MAERMAFHFDGALADSHRMNFYESARFQYAAARLLVKLAQFRSEGKFVKNITNGTNLDIQLVSQSDGSFNINVEGPSQSSSEDPFVKISLADLIAYVSERIVEKVDDSVLHGVALANRRRVVDGAPDSSDPAAAIEQLVEAAMADSSIIANLQPQTRDLIRRRVAEAYREKRLTVSQAPISLIDFARSQKLIAMSAPLISEMATALRKSANTLEITSTVGGQSQPVLFLDRKMAQEIETAVVDQEITPMLGNITQFNKENGWGKLKVEGKIISFSIPSDILPTIRPKLIDSMKKDVVFLQTYQVKDRSGEVVRLIAVGILPTPEA
ncbi:hypothetical protein [Methylorubrum extorquens]|uniref:hypothetical protein n=1 Tax=Methylorubrum extorquens TaxID=408 RepID=UPI0012372594|nr:hypothetical protein [Methylorubrum extorquens]WIU38104.1 hypothetical protein KQ926_15975 [Methylorubrum extorquens]